MNMPLFCDLAETNDHHRYILNQVKLEFALRRQSPLFYTISSEQDVDFVFDIQECNLHVCNTVVPPQTIASHTATLAKDKPALYPLQRSFLKVFSIPQASLHWPGESLFGNRIPNLMYVVLIKTGDLQGDNQDNLYAFYHNNISSITFYGDNRTIGGQMLEILNFFGNDTTFLDAYSRLFCDEGHEPDIDREDFCLGNTIFVYKSATNSPNTLSLERRGHTRLEIKFSEATSEALSVLVYGKLNGIMTITSTRVVSVE